MKVDTAAWEFPAIFKFLQKSGGVSDYEMHRTFNNGIGMIVVVPDNMAQDLMDRLAAMGESAYLIGEVSTRDSDADPQVEWV